MTTELEHYRQLIISEVQSLLGRLVRLRDGLAVEQRFALAETLRNVADALDRGRPFRPQKRALRRLVQTNQRDASGRQLFRIAE
jgi:hypothetical protein